MIQIILKYFNISKNFKKKIIKFNKKYKNNNETLLKIYLIKLYNIYLKYLN